MDVFLPAQNVPESLIANLSALLDLNYLRSGTFQTPAVPLMVLTKAWVQSDVRAASAWLSLALGLSFGLSQEGAGTRSADRKSVV